MLHGTCGPESESTTNVEWEEADLSSEAFRDSADVIRFYRRHGKSKALRRVAELAFRHGANVAEINDLEYGDFSGSVGWKAELEDLRERFGFAGCYEPAKRIEFRQERKDKPTLLVGYALVRPAPNGTLIEGLVPPPPDAHASYLTCSVAPGGTGIELSDGVDNSGLWGTVFVQQDSHSGTCAHACIRAVSLLLRSNFSATDVLTFPEISRRAASSDPRSGLSEDEIVQVLDSIGCSVLSFDPRRSVPEVIPSQQTEATGPGQPGETRAKTPGVEDNTRPEDLTFYADEYIYHYIESGLPVIATINTPPARHAFFFVGHSFDRDSWWPEARGGYAVRLDDDHEWLPSSLWSGSFYVQDDNYGPYMSMSRELCRQLVDFIVVPIPREINLQLRAEEVEPYAARLIYDPLLIEMIEKEYNRCEWKDHIIERQRDRRIVLRTLLVKSSEFIDSVEVTACRYDAGVKKAYSRLKLPPWIWLVEVSAAELYGATMMKLGEVLVDPSAMKQHLSGASAAFSIHLAGVMWPDPSRRRAQFFANDQPTEVYSRQTFAERARELKQDLGSVDADTKTSGVP